MKKKIVILIVVSFLLLIFFGTKSNAGFYATAAYGEIGEIVEITFTSYEVPISLNGSITTGTPTSIEIVSVSSNIGTVGLQSVSLTPEQADGSHMVITVMAKVLNNEYYISNIYLLLSYMTTAYDTRPTQTWTSVTWNGINPNNNYVEADEIHTYDNSQYVEPEKSSDNYLKSLAIEGLELNREFNKDALEYGITISEDTENLKVLAESEDENSTVTITGNESLKVGNNNILIEVKAENEEIRTYSITVNKLEKTRLKNLSLQAIFKDGNKEDIILSPVFSQEEFNYISNVIAKAKGIEVNAIGLTDDLIITVDKESELVEGENIIKINVKRDGWKEVVYEIVINKEVKDNSMIIIISIVGTGILIVGVSVAVFVRIRKRKTN